MLCDIMFFFYLEDFFFYYNGMKFLIKDCDNDKVGVNCVVVNGNGWWFNVCYYFNLNGIFYKKEIFILVGMIWFYWDNVNKWVLLKLFKMMIKLK